MDAKILAALLSALVSIIEMIIKACGPLAADVVNAVKRAKTDGVTGEDARHRVFNETKTNRNEESGWLINLLIECAVGLEFGNFEKLAKKMINKIKPSWLKKIRKKLKIKW